MEHNFELHSLMTDLQIAYYMSLRYSDEGKVLNHKEAVSTLKAVAKNAIVNKRIPRSLFMYAKVFIVADNPMAVVEQAYAIYGSSNPDEVNSDGTVALQA